MPSTGSRIDFIVGTKLQKVHVEIGESDHLIIKGLKNDTSRLISINEGFLARCVALLPS
jgi:hypothetical protein